MQTPINDDSALFVWLGRELPRCWSLVLKESTKIVTSTMTTMMLTLKYRTTEMGRETFLPPPSGSILTNQCFFFHHYSFSPLPHTTRTYLQPGLSLTHGDNSPTATGEGSPILPARPSNFSGKGIITFRRRRGKGEGWRPEWRPISLLSRPRSV